MRKWRLASYGCSKRSLLFWYETRTVTLYEKRVRSRTAVETRSIIVSNENAPSLFLTRQTTHLSLSFLLSITFSDTRRRGFLRSVVRLSSLSLARSISLPNVIFENVLDFHVSLVHDRARVLSSFVPRRRETDGSGVFTTTY